MVLINPTADWVIVVGIILGVMIHGLHKKIDGLGDWLEFELAAEEEKKFMIEQRRAEKERRQARRDRWWRFGPAVILIATCFLLVWLFGAR